LLITLIAVALAAAGVSGSPRVAVTLVFALTAPGWVVAAFFLPMTPALEWSVATSLSIAFAVVVTMLMLLTHSWAPVAVFVIYASATAGLLTFHLVRSLLHAPSSDALRRNAA